MRRGTFVAAAALVLGAASAAEAQIFTPTYQSPVRGGDIGVYLADDAVGRGLSVEGVLRLAMTRSDLGLRLGVAEAGEDATAILLGIDYRNPIELAAAPLALAFTAGAQAALGDAEAFGGQVGLSVGYPIRGSGVTVTPYIHPRVALVDFGEDSDFEVLADLGVDLSLAQNLMLRFGANLGEGADFGIGLAWRR